MFVVVVLLFGLPDRVLVLLQFMPLRTRRGHTEPRSAAAGGTAAGRVGCLLGGSGGGLSLCRLASLPCPAIRCLLCFALLRGAHHAGGEGIGSGLNAEARAFLLVHGSLLFRGRATARKQRGEQTYTDESTPSQDFVTSITVSHPHDSTIRSSPGFFFYR